MSLTPDIRKRLAGRLVGITLSTPPSNVPLLATAKDHVAVETSASDALLQRYVDAAVRYVELASRTSLFDQSRTLVLDSFPDEDFIKLYSSPLKSVTSFTVYDTLDVADATFNKYTVDVVGTRLLLNYGYYWPTYLRSNSAVKIVYVSGYGTTVAALPPNLVQAVMLLVGSWFANRESGGCTVTPELAMGVSDLIGQARELRV
jgi:uncharacterized phiE125 gp8 family phage protein